MPSKAERERKLFTITNLVFSANHKLHQLALIVASKISNLEFI